MSVDLDIIKKQRTAARGWASRARNKLDQIVSADIHDSLEINDALTDFETRLRNLDTVQMDLEKNLPEKELLEGIEKSADFRDSLKTSQLAAYKALNKVKSEPRDDVKNDVSSLSKDNVKLPKLTLPSFSGDVKN